MTPATSSQERIRDLNDAFRASGSSASGQWMITRGVQMLGAEFVILATRAVAAFDNFAPGNDPYGEHDFGSVKVAGERLFWKIDYYDPSLSYGSNDPADPAVTRRIMTIMLASEY